VVLYHQREAQSVPSRVPVRLDLGRPFTTLNVGNETSLRRGIERSEGVLYFLLDKLIIHPRTVTRFWNH
jgi:hypothetical protein